MTITDSTQIVIGDWSKEESEVHMITQFNVFYKDEVLNTLWPIESLTLLPPLTVGNQCNYCIHSIFGGGFNLAVWQI